jgi:hypothetical protein
MPERTCSTCTWWLTGDDVVRPFLDDWSSDDPLRTRDEWGMCALTEVGNGDQLTHRSKAFVVDEPSGYPYHGMLCTAPDFACNQWQAKDEGA